MQALFQYGNNFFSSSVFEIEVFGNSLGRYALSLVIFIALYALFSVLFRRVVSRLAEAAESTATTLDDVILRVVKGIKPPFYTFLAVYFAFKFLLLNSTLDSALNAVLTIVFVFQAVTAIQVFIQYVIRRRLYHDDAGRAESSVSMLTLLAKLLLWTLGLLLVLSNLGVDITSLIAGLGIGGIAVALALQNILNDLFSSFALHFDKPFVAGDFIIVGDKMGVVQKIGIKTTRIKALQGEEIVISNQELTTAKIQNFKRMSERRVPFTFGVLYETPIAKLRRIPETLKAIVVEEKLARFDRAHFQKFGDYALIFEVVYYLQSADYNEYMDTQQSLNLKIMEAFEKEGIGFAYPTQTLYLHRAGDVNRVKDKLI